MLPSALARNVSSSAAVVMEPPSQPRMTRGILAFMRESSFHRGDVRAAAASDLQALGVVADDALPAAADEHAAVGAEVVVIIGAVVRLQVVVGAVAAAAVVVHGEADAQSRDVAVDG